MTTSAATKTHYNHTAWFYEQMAGAYSMGKIKASKLAELEFIASGDRVLYPGAGGGEAAAAAAAEGAEVTCIDIAPAMLSRIQGKLDAGKLDAELIRGDILEHDRVGYYDVVCANYFLNIFEDDLMRQIYAHLATLVKPGGLMMIADFAPARGGPIARALHFVYYRMANATFWLLTRTPLHPVYDYEGIGADLGLEHKTTVFHRLFPGGPEYFQTLVLEKPS